MAVERSSVPSPDLVRPPAPVMAPLIVNVCPELVTVIVLVAAKAMARLMVFVPEAVLSVMLPVSVMELPAKVKPLVSIVMSAKLVAAVKLLLVA